MDVAAVSNPGQALPVVPDTASPQWLVENRELIRSVKSVDASALFGEGSELTFALDRETKRPVARVVNPQTGEVLWQAPPEYMLRLAETLDQHGT
ncbi:MAG TPA: flagellar protein FlaG [Bryobacteraceae bacterium]|nr:flagellar protein FlaG [Bryobacteraceae bacterium]